MPGRRVVPRKRGTSKASSPGCGRSKGASLEARWLPFLAELFSIPKGPSTS